MKYQITIDHSKKLIYYKHGGIIELSEIGEAWKEFTQLTEFSQHKYNIFADYRNSKFNFTVKDFDTIRTFLYSLKDKLIGRKQSIIVDNPYNTAISMLFETELSEKIGFSVKVFSTEEAATEWATI